MRVAVLISGSLDNVTGGYIYDRLLVEHLRSNGHQVSVFSIPFHSYAGKLLENLSATVIRQLERFSPDILLQDELDHSALFQLNRRLKPGLNYPVVSIVHHLRSCELRPSWKNRAYRWLERRYLSTIDGFVFVSTTTRLAVESLVGDSRPSVVAYPCGNRLPGSITRAQIESRAESQGPLRLLFVGNVVPRKGLHVLLSALARVPPAKSQLTVIGDLSMDKPYVKSIREMVAKKELGERVAFLGRVSDAELAKRLQESHLLVVPSSYEGYGMAYLEAMGFGLPAIASNCGACAEIITSGKDGFLVDFGDEVSLARHIVVLSDHRKKLVEMSLNALARYHAHPAWQVTCESILNFMENIAGK